MQKEEILAWIKKTLSENFDIPADKITADAHLYHDLDIDSIDAVDLLIQLKQLTGQSLSPEAFKQVRTVGDVVDVVYANISDA